MAGFPLTAWALRHPWGGDADAVFDRTRAAASSEAPPSAPPIESLAALLDELEPAWSRARARWGASRVAVVSGAAVPTGPTSVSPDALRARVRARLGPEPAYLSRLAYRAGALMAMVSAERLIRASLVDAVLVAAVGDRASALVLVERLGEGFVGLRASAEASGPAEGSPVDAPTLRDVVSPAWSVAGSAPLDYVHALPAVEASQAAAEDDALRAVLGSVPCGRAHPEDPAGLDAVGATDVVLAAVSLRRGFAPHPAGPELEHDRVLVVGRCPASACAALLLEARA